MLPVALAPLLLALKQAAIDEYLKAVTPTGIAAKVDEVFGAGYGSRRAEKLNVGHESVLRERGIFAHLPRLP